MKSIEYTAQEVVQFALKTQGYDVEIKVIEQWIEGEIAPPEEMAEVVTAIIAALPWHIKRFQAEKMYSADVHREAFTSVAQKDKRHLNNVHKASQAKAAAMQKIDLGTLYFPKRIHDSFTAICKVLQISRTRFIQNIVQSMVETVIDSSKVDLDENKSGFDNSTGTYKATQRRKRFARDETSKVIRFTKDVKKGVENVS